MRKHVSLFCIAIATFTLGITSVSYADNPEGVRIIRDEYGVPHIYAENAHDLWYAVGYSTAQDRLWQADLLRRTAEGTQAELLGQSALGGDVFARTLFGTDTQREQMLAQASVNTQKQFQAYADGVNAWITQAQASGTLPVEYQGATPAPWKTTDSVAVLQLIFMQFGQDGADEISNANDLQYLMTRFSSDDAMRIFDDTHWLNDSDAYTTVPQDGSSPVIKTHDLKQFHEQYNYQDSNQDFDKQRDGFKHNLEHLGITKKMASNAILIGPKLSADGHALLMGGPQMGNSVPQIAMEMSIHLEDLNVHGITFAGIPGISMGTTHYFSWSFTSGISDTEDIYVDSIASTSCRTETFNIHGVTTPYTTQVCESAHGPVFYIDAANGIAYTLKSAVRGYSVQSFEALQKAEYAHSIADIDDAMAKWAPNYNMLIADVRGNIAYRHLGFIPIHVDTDNPWLPHNGDGSSEWQGYIPYQDLPHATNPEQGWLVNWNNKPSSDWNNTVYDFGDFGPVQRVDTLVRQLQALQPGTVTTDTLATINKVAAFTNQTPSNNTIGVFTPKLLPLMLAHVDTSADSRLAEVVARLSSWNQLQTDSDNDGKYDDPAVAIFDTWYTLFTNQVFADDLGPYATPGVMANMSYRMLEPASAISLQYNYLGSESVGNAITTSLIQTLNTLQATYGSSDINTWLADTAVLHWTQMGAASVPDGQWMNRGTYNQILHMGHGQDFYGYNVVAPGQSGNPYSPHFADQLMLYYTMTYKPMNLTLRQQKGNAESVLILFP